MVDQNKLVNYTIILVMCAAIVGVFFMVMNNFSAEARQDTVTVTGESVTPRTAGTYLAKNITNVECYGEMSIIDVRNATAAGLWVAPGNYTYNAVRGWLANATGSFTNTTGTPTWYVNYSYKSGKEACEGIDDTFTVGTTFADWFDIVIIVAIAGILLLIVYKVVFSKGSSSTEM